MAWLRANLVPLVLLPLAACLIWIAVWRIWLPPPGSADAVARSVTTVDANTPTRPTHKVTRVVRATRAAGPARRSEPLALALVFLGAGAAVVAVFHDRIGSIQLGKDGIKIELTEAERTGAAQLVERLAGDGAPAAAYARGLQRYLGTIASRRSVRAASTGELDPVELANRIADKLVS
jgi:hypothetical protein